MALRIALSAFTLVTLVAVGVGGAGLQSAPPTGGGGGGDCSSLVLNMADCLSYVTNGSKVEKPEGGCCSGLKTVLKTNAECLCEGFKSSSQFGVVLNVTKALQLPDACHVKAPSASSCGLSLSPAGAPGPAGSSLPPSVAGAPSSSIANAPSMGASETVPTPAPMKAGSSALRSSMGSILWAMAAAAFFSFTAF